MDGQSSSSATFSIDEMAYSIQKRLNLYGILSTHGHKVPLICRVFKQIREVDPTAYEPVILSIGPYHRSASTVLATEKEKWKCLKFILNINRQKELQDYLTEIMKIEERVRICYQDDINIESKDFIQMLLLDGCFLLHSLYATNEIAQLPAPLHARDVPSMPECSNMLSVEAELKTTHGIQDSTIQSETRGDVARDQSQYSNLRMGQWYAGYIARDIFLLENQIPFFVIKLIYEILGYKKAVNAPLAETFAKYVEDIIQYFPTAIPESNRPRDFDHLLHLCHIYFKPSQHVAHGGECIQSTYTHSFFYNCRKYFDLSWYENHSNQTLNLTQANQLKRWRRAIQYHEAGVQFIKREDSKHGSHSLLDISFDRGLLVIPCLPIDDTTYVLFRNFVAFEQACPQFGNDLTAYVAFMSHLISTPDDVTFLSRRGIIVHHMRCDANVSSIFGNLGKNIDFDINGNYYLNHLCQKLEEHYQNRMKRWIAWLWQNHFSNPWLSLAVVAAAIVLICTILQTLFSLLSYMNPST